MHITSDSVPKKKSSSIYVELYGRINKKILANKYSSHVLADFGSEISCVRPYYTFSISVHCPDRSGDPCLARSYQTSIISLLQFSCPYLPGNKPGGARWMESAFRFIRTRQPLADYWMWSSFWNLNAVRPETRRLTLPLPSHVLASQCSLFALTPRVKKLPPNCRSIVQNVWPESFENPSANLMPFPIRFLK